MNKKSAILFSIIVLLECIAMAYIFTVEGPAGIRYYTVNSNILLLLSAIGYLACFASGKEIPKALTVLHLTSAVCLSITFLIAALVLAPQSSYAAYFIDNVASIVHFFGPVLSVVTLMMRKEEIPKYAVCVPALISILYGIIALILNAARVMKGPYFFLEVYSTPPGTIAMWFGIIFVLCVVLTAGYMFIHRKVSKS